MCVFGSRAGERSNGTTDARRDAESVRVATVRGGGGERARESVRACFPTVFAAVSVFDLHRIFGSTAKLVCVRLCV